jgi:hypothetical protein
MNSRLLMPEAQDLPTAGSDDAITAGIGGQRNGANGSNWTSAILSRRCLTGQTETFGRYWRRIGLP